MRIAVVFDKSGTVVKAHRILCDVETGECFHCDSTLKYVANGGEALVNVTGPLGGIAKRDLRRLGLKISCAPEGWKRVVGKDVLSQTGVMDALGLAIARVEKDFDTLGVCGALLVRADGKVTHAVALGGELYDDVPSVVSEIRGAGDDVFLATGNCRLSSMACARVLGIPPQFVLFDADPLEKRDLVRRLKSFYGAVVMVGNDINDLEAMAEAEVSVLLKREDSPPVDGVESRAEVDFTVGSMEEVVNIIKMVKEPLPRNIDPGTRGACGGARQRSRSPTP